MRRGWIHLLLAPAVAACGLVAGIEDVTVFDDAQGLEGGTVPPRDDNGNPLLPDGAIEPIDAPTDSPVVNDGNTRCNPLKAFGAPVPIASLNTASDDSTPRFSANELTVYFASDRPGHLGAGSVYTAKRATLAGAFSTPVLMNNIDVNNGAIYHPAITGDELKIVVQADFGNPSGTDLYLATRPSAAGDFPVPTLLQNNVSSNGFEFIPFLTADGTNLYFASNRAGPFQLYQSIAAAGVFAAPTLIAGVGSGDGAVADTAPVLSADLLTIYFASTRVNAAANVYDLFVARRTTPTGVFATPTLVPELNDANAAISDVPGWLSADDCRLYMTSDRASGGAASDVYVATRTP